MDLSVIHPQIVISVVLIVIAAVVALLVDYLKKRSEQLRAVTAELERLRQAPEAPAAPPALPPLMPESPKVTAERTPRRREGSAPVRRMDREDMQRAQERAASLASVRGRRETAPPQVENDATREALNEWLIRRATARAAQKMERDRMQSEPEATPAPVAVPEPVEAALPAALEEIAEPVVERPVEQIVEQPVEPVVPAPEAEVIPEPVAAEPEPVAVPFHAATLPEVHVDSFLWESLFAQSQPVAAVAPRPVFEVIQGAGTPRGIQDEASFIRLIENRKPFSGLAVSIGVNENDGRQVENSDLLNAIADYVSTLLRDRDFGCRVSDDEFVLVCPGEVGADAQRRLSQISERLFDYQLRCIGTHSILFSSGGVDVDHEPLAEAINGATERMTQTRRSRKTVSVQSSRRTAAAV
ncbi:MAG: hypothetical protein M3O35_17045 [Acidobacteriota bacterium]|nr:hypothetical protein [Acidobacteriota bacterium]